MSIRQNIPSATITSQETAPGHSFKCGKCPSGKIFFHLRSQVRRHCLSTVLSVVSVHQEKNIPSATITSQETLPEDSFKYRKCPSGKIFLQLRSQVRRQRLSTFLSVVSVHQAKYSFSYDTSQETLPEHSFKCGKCSSGKIFLQLRSQVRRNRLSTVLSVVRVHQATYSFSYDHKSGEIA